jgi:glycosyltransferase involved in cell wall biosynthesis
MMAGLPVVSSDVGGVRETVYEKTSFLFRYQDMDGLKNCIIKALNIPDKNFFNDENYIKHLEKFSAETMVKNFCGILNKITGEDL